MLLAGARSDAGSSSQQQQWVQEGSRWHMAGGTLNRGASAAGPMSQGHAAGTDEASELRKRVSDLAGVQTTLASGHKTSEHLCQQQWHIGTQ